MGTTVDPAVERQRALERSMARVRWFGIALGVYQTLWYEPNPGTPDIGATSTAVSLGALGLLALVNLWVLLALRRDPDASHLRRTGAAVFGADIVAVWLIIVAFSFEPFSTTWVILTILALEGALRSQMRGAMVPVVLAIPLETGREIIRLSTLPELQDVSGAGYLISAVSFRIGVVFMVGAVAGAIARNLERERGRAEERAEQMEALAENETAARRESAAFQHVILAGVRADDLQRALGSMVEVITTELGYERTAVLLLEDDRFVVAASSGFPDDVADRRVEVGRGIVGRVVQTGEAAIVDDATADPDYLCVDERTRSQVTVPIVNGSAVIGALDVESSHVGTFDASDADRLSRLAAQMALVIENARLLATERATVERLQELDQMKSDFIAIASHELRTPLTSMQGSIKTLRRLRNVDQSTTDELIGILDRQSDRLTRLVEDLLLTSRIDSGSIQLHMSSTDLPGIVDDILAQLGPAADRVSVALAPTIPRMVTDEHRLGQILRNLIENALKFTEAPGTVRVTAHHVGGALRIEVADDGPGIDEADRSLVFDRFHQVGGSMRRRSDGLGLGLFITRRLTEALGGTIEVESEPGAGTVFRVTLPLAAVGRGEAAGTA